MKASLRLDFDIQDGGLANAGMIQARVTLARKTDVGKCELYDQCSHENQLRPQSGSISRSTFFNVRRVR